MTVVIALNGVQLLARNRTLKVELLPHTSGETKKIVGQRWRCARACQLNVSKLHATYFTGPGSCQAEDIKRIPAKSRTVKTACAHAASCFGTLVELDATWTAANCSCCGISARMAPKKRGKQGGRQGGHRQQAAEASQDAQDDQVRGRQRCCRSGTARNTVIGQAHALMLSVGCLQVELHPLLDHLQSLAPMDRVNAIKPWWNEQPAARCATHACVLLFDGTVTEAHV